MNSYSVPSESYNTVFPSTVTLSADAVPAPGGYVVPEGGNITFTCNHSLSDGGVFWKVDLRVPMGRASYTASMGVANLIPQVSSPDNATKANPATIIINNITSQNNRSIVECSRDGSISDASIIVEGEGSHTKYNFHVINMQKYNHIIGKDLYTEHVL